MVQCESRPKKEMWRRCNAVQTVEKWVSWILRSTKIQLYRTRVIQQRYGPLWWVAQSERAPHRSDIQAASSLMLRRNCVSARKWRDRVSDATTALFDGSVCTEPGLLSGGDLDNSAETLLEASLHFLGRRRGGCLGASIVRAWWLIKTDGGQGRWLETGRGRVGSRVSRRGSAFPGVCGGQKFGRVEVGAQQSEALVVTDRPFPAKASRGMSDGKDLAGICWTIREIQLEASGIETPVEATQEGLRGPRGLPPTTLSSKKKSV